MGKNAAGGHGLALTAARPARGSSRSVALAFLAPSGQHPGAPRGACKGELGQGRGDADRNRLYATSSSTVLLSSGEQAVKDAIPVIGDCA